MHLQLPVEFILNKWSIIVSGNFSGSMSLNGVQYHDSRCMNNSRKIHKNFHNHKVKLKMEKSPSSTGDGYNSCYTDLEAP